MPDKLQWQTSPYFGGGLNNNQAATQIADDELADILNFEFDVSDDLKARNGFIRQNTAPDFATRITSIFNFILAAGTSHIIVTTAAEIYKNTAGIYSSIKGAVALPTNTYWQWRAFNDVAIGVNQQTGGAEKGIIKWTGAGNVSANALTGISGAPDGAHSIEVFNNRLWVVFSNLPNRLYYSELGANETWNGTGGFIEIGYNDGDKIIGIYANRKRLFIFKRYKIYVLETGVGGVVNTNPAGWNIDVISKNIGCVSRYTIQALLDDVIFLADEGVASLQAAENYDSFFTVFLSRNIQELSRINFSVDTFGSAILPTKSWYVLALPKTTAGVVNNRFYVLDYSKIRTNKLRWTKFESAVVNPSTLAIVLVNGKKTLFIGSDATSPQVYYLDTGTIYNDDGIAVTKSFKSKAFSYDKPLERKEYNKWAANINFTTTDLQATMIIRLDEDDQKQIPYSINLPAVSAGGLWDTALWGIDKFFAGPVNTQLIERKIKSDIGNRARSGQFIFMNTQLNQDIVIQDLGFNVDLLDTENA